MLSSHMIHRAPPPLLSAERGKFYLPQREKKDEEIGEVGAVIYGGGGAGTNKDDSKKAWSLHFVPSTIPLLHRSIRRIIKIYIFIDRINS